jgi:3-dehydroquinate dehydratase/shikimate dehydrogenase
MIEKYRPYIDMAELRVDCLLSDETIDIRPFPAMAGIPVILTVRRRQDGGFWAGGEASRIATFGRALAFAQADTRNNFAYVDIEEDLSVISVEEAARAFGTRVIRSFHNISGTDSNLAERAAALSRTGDEIVKAAVLPKTFHDVLAVFRAGEKLREKEKILIAMGPLGLCTRILAPKIGSEIIFAAVKGEDDFPSGAEGQLDPIELTEIYRVRAITERTGIYGITGWPLAATGSPAIHNGIYRENAIDAVYVPFPSDSLEDFLTLANEIGIKGASVTIPYKEKLLPFLTCASPRVDTIGAANTIVRRENGWYGYNTDAPGFGQSLLSLVYGDARDGRDDLKKMRVTIIGAGGAAKAVAHEVHVLKAKALILNRTEDYAKAIAQKYGFKWGSLSGPSLREMRRYSDIIIQTSSVGMSDGVPGDPVPDYEFSGSEVVLDIIYKPAETLFLSRAARAGCKTANGSDMLLRQAILQHRLFFE